LTLTAQGNCRRAQNSLRQPKHNKNQEGTLKVASVFATLSLGALAGCTAHQTVAEPNVITLSQAMKDTVDALADARAEGQLRHTDLGFHPCTVTAVFNISATGTADNKVALGISGGPPAAIAPVTVNLSGSSESTQAGSRGNTVTLVLATPSCLPQTAAAAPAGKAKAGASPAGKGGTPKESGIFDNPLPVKAR
jgi:hypothetical protein